MLQTLEATYQSPLRSRSFLTVSTGTLASRLLGFARDSEHRGAACAGRPGSGCVPGGVSTGQCGQAVVAYRRRPERGAGAGPGCACARPIGAAVAAAAFAGRVLGTVSAALIAATVLIGLLDVLAFGRMTALGAGVCRNADAATGRRGRAADAALHPRGFAGPVTVMMALMNAQGRFALTAFSPLLAWRR